MSGRNQTQEAKLRNLLSKSNKSNKDLNKQITKLKKEIKKDKPTSRSKRPGHIFKEIIKVKKQNKEAKAMGSKLKNIIGSDALVGDVKPGKSITVNPRKHEKTNRRRSSIKLTST